MSERIDVLIPVAAKLPYFTVNTGAADVGIVGSYDAADVRLFNAEGASIFSKGDNFVVATMGLVMPLSFQIDRKSTVVNPFIQFIVAAQGVTTGKIYSFREIGAEDADSFMYHVMENYDMPVDIFIDLQNQAAVTGSYIKNERFRMLLALKYAGMKVSMVGVPDDLHGTIQCITPYIKVYHNFALSSS